MVGLPGVHIEVKRTERLHIYDAMAQAVHDSEGKRLPAVFHRRNNCEWIVMMPLDDWMKLYSAWEADRDE